MPFDQANYNPLPVGHQRLLVLADFLETKVPADKFNLVGWAWSANFMNECGTTACACGWATTIPEFMALGLRLRPKPTALLPGAQMLVFGRRVGFGAARSFFDIELEQARFLFDPERYYSDGLPYKDKAVVVTRIRAFVAKEQAKSQTQSLGAVGAHSAA